MRKAPLTLLTFTVVIGLTVPLGAGLIRRDNVQRVKRAQQILDALRQLEIGKSDLTAANSIAAKFGNAPPPRGFGGRYNKENCAAPDHLETCTYMILMNNSPVQMLFAKHPSLPRLVAQEWLGNAQIGISGGTVSSYYFFLRYKTSNGQWGVVGTDVNQELPKFQSVEARISDSYSVQAERIDAGFRLQSSLTPTASTYERQRASDIDLSCLARLRGCGGVSETMPEAWEDFVEKCTHCSVEQMKMVFGTH